MTGVFIGGLDCSHATQLAIRHSAGKRHSGGGRPTATLLTANAMVADGNARGGCFRRHVDQRYGRYTDTGLTTRAPDLSAYWTAHSTPPHLRAGCRQLAIHNTPIGRLTFTRSSVTL
jgi:hypothetical protein